MAPPLLSSTLNKKEKEKPVNYLIYQQHQLYRPVNLGRTTSSASNRTTTLQTKLKKKTNTQPSPPSPSGPSHSQGSEQHIKNKTNCPKRAPVDDDESSRATATAGIRAEQQAADVDTNEDDVWNRSLSPFSYIEEQEPASSDSDPEIICQLLLPPEAKSKPDLRSMNALKQPTGSQPPGSDSTSDSKVLPNDAQHGIEGEAPSRQSVSEDIEEEIDELEEDSTVDQVDNELEKVSDAQQDNHNQNLIEHTSGRRSLSRHFMREAIEEPMTKPSSQQMIGKEQADTISDAQSEYLLEDSSSQQHPSPPAHKRRKTRHRDLDSNEGRSQNAPIVIDSDSESFEKPTDTDDVVPLVGTVGNSFATPNLFKSIPSDQFPGLDLSSEPGSPIPPKIIDSDGVRFDTDVGTDVAVPPVEAVNTPLMASNLTNIIPEHQLPAWELSRERRSSIPPRIVGSDGLSFDADVDTNAAILRLAGVSNSFSAPNPSKLIPRENKDVDKTYGALAPHGDSSGTIIPPNTFELDGLKLEEAVNLLRQLDAGRFFLNRFAD